MFSLSSSAFSGSNLTNEATLPILKLNSTLSIILTCFSSVLCFSGNRIDLRSKNFVGICVFECHVYSISEWDSTHVAEFDCLETGTNIVFFHEIEKYWDFNDTLYIHIRWTITILESILYFGFQGALKSWVVVSFSLYCISHLSKFAGKPYMSF